MRNQTEVARAVRTVFGVVLSAPMMDAMARIGVRHGMRGVRGSTLRALVKLGIVEHVPAVAGGLGLTEFGKRIDDFLWIAAEWSSDVARFAEYVGLTRDGARAYAMLCDVQAWCGSVVYDHVLVAIDGASLASIERASLAMPVERVVRAIIGQIERSEPIADSDENSEPAPVDVIARVTLRAHGEAGTPNRDALLGFGSATLVAVAIAAIDDAMRASDITLDDVTDGIESQPVEWMCDGGWLARFRAVEISVTVDAFGDERGFCVRVPCGNGYHRSAWLATVAV